VNAPVRTTPVRVKHHTAKPAHQARPKTKPHPAAIHMPTLPPVVVPPFVESTVQPLRRDPLTALAALALALAAVTAGSGAGLAYTWSRR